MNPIDQNTPTSDDRRFDLLADGELNESTRRELLSRLDDEPGGWRRCALAFLEAQSWRHEFRTLGGESSAELHTSRPAGWFRFGGPAGTLLAMAASFVVALVLVGLVQGICNPGTPGGGPETSGIVDQVEMEGAVHEAGPTDSRTPDLPGKPESVPPKVWLVGVPGAAGPEGEGQTIPVLAVERDRLGEGWLESLPAPLSPEVLEQLRKAGLRVEQRRKLLPWRMEDGRRLVVPVDEVDLHYVGNPTL